jgi:hypothetical protein
VRRISRQFGNVRSRRWLLQGLLDWEHGHADRARKAWRRAEATAVSMDTPYERARAQYEIARHDAAGAGREAYLADAAATLERLGALQMLNRVRKAQAQLDAEEAG